MEPYNEQLEEYLRTHKSTSNKKQEFTHVFSYDMYKRRTNVAPVPRHLILKETMEKINGNRENL